MLPFLVNFRALLKRLSMTCLTASSSVSIHEGTSLPNSNSKNWVEFYRDKRLHYIFDLIDIGGLIIADNVLWSRKVTKHEKDEETAALDRYNKKVIASNRVEAVLFPIRDGLMISRKIK